MTKQPFTPSGVNLKIQELYALTDTDLTLEVNLMKADFVDWLNDNFNLTVDQVTYLGSIDDNFLSFAAINSSQAALARLPIELSILTAAMRSSKYIRCISTLIPKYDSVTGFSISGDVTFEIGYT